MTLQALYALADQSNIPVVAYPLPENGSMSLLAPDGSCVVGMDPGVLDGGSRERVHLGHELGHCMTGAFYTKYTPAGRRGKDENMADRWAVRELIPEAALDDAVASGCTQMWELAQHFQVTEGFMRKAVCLHVHGNLAAHLYF